MNITRINAIALLILPCIAGAAYYIYSASLSGPFNFDDAPNLQALTSIKDLPSALAFIVNGASGPLGRPIALASFALQFSAWPHAPEEFLYTNILIHLINGLLVAWFALRLAQARSDIGTCAVPFALTLSSLWTLQPLLASASLMVVQRMTTLCSTFMLLGLIGYLVGRQRIVTSTSQGWITMVGSLSMATIVAVLTKETGALLPIYVWVLEYTLLDAPKKNPVFHTWKRLLYVPLFALAGYAVLALPHLFEVTQRGFSAWQRLLTEGPILWTYLRLLLLPRATGFGPFHDDIPVSASLPESPEALLAWASWAGLIAAVVTLRRRFPWFSFAAGWFLLGHALESTLFNLELYFEHRNYLPSIGPLAWASAMAWTIPRKYQRAVLTAVAMYLFLLAFVLHEVTAAWGDPDVAAHLWADRHRNSERAQQFLANRLLASGDVRGALSIIERGFMDNPGNSGLALQAVQLSCELNQDVSAKLIQTVPHLAHSYANYSLSDTIERLMEIQQRGKCPGLTVSAIHTLIDTLLENPNLQGSAATIFKLHHFKARLYFESRELDPTVRHLEQAFTALPDLDTAVLIIGTLISAGLRDEALKKLETFRQSLPVNPIIRQQLENRLSDIGNDLRHEARASARN